MCYAIISVIIISWSGQNELRHFTRARQFSLLKTLPARVRDIAVNCSNNKITIIIQRLSIDNLRFVFGAVTCMHSEKLIKLMYVRFAIIKRASTGSNSNVCRQFYYHIALVPRYIPDLFNASFSACNIGKRACMHGGQVMYVHHNIV